MLNRLIFLSILVVVSLAVSGCDGTTDEDFDSQLVVSAFLGASEALPPIGLSRTLPLFETYTAEAAAVSGADVRITLIGADGSDEAVYSYLPGAASGTYVAADDEAAVLERRTYRLDIVADGVTLTATTLVPPDFDLIEGPGDFVEYGSGQGPELRITRSTTVERRAVFVASVRALAPVQFEEVTIDGETRYRGLLGEGQFRPAGLLLRFLGCVQTDDVLLCEDDPRDLDADVGTSPVINEASYIDNGDGSLTVQIPYLAFGYLGPQRIRLISLDAAFQDFVQTQAVQGGGSTLSPGEIPNVTTNIEGGLGVFGSFAQVITSTTLTEPAQ